MLDEVQTGVGRTGHWFAHQADGVEPDVVTLAKGLGGGLPIGATLAFGDAADLLGPGAHGTTFGGNPVSCAAALAVVGTIANEGLLDHVKRVGERLRRGIEALGHPLVSERARRRPAARHRARPTPAARGHGRALRDAGFLVNAVQPDVDPAGAAADPHPAAGRRVRWPRPAGTSWTQLRGRRLMTRTSSATTTSPPPSRARCSTWPPR